MSNLISFLEYAKHESETGDTMRAIDFIEEAEYELFECGKGDTKTDEAKGLIEDAKSSLKNEEQGKGCIFIGMAIDVLTLPGASNYVYNQVGMDTVSEEMDKLSDTEIDADNKIEVVQWHMDMRRLKERMMKLLVSDHKKRFNLAHL